jgi:ABC-type uncharacterized transport system substrate-binding protein
VSELIWVGQLKKLFLSAALLLGLTPQVHAHPHLFATIQTAVMTSAEGKVTGLRIRWNFDETYTRFSLEGLDLNNNGTYEPEEMKPLTDENIKSLVESTYFTIAKFDNQELPQGPVTVYGQDMIDDKLSLWFELPFVTPVDVKAGHFEVRIYDPDFFIGFDYAADKPTEVVGQLPAGCAIKLLPLPTNEELDQTRTMLADKPQDWKPEQPTDFGAMFAQSLVIPCG